MNDSTPNNDGGLLRERPPRATNPSLVGIFRYSVGGKIALALTLPPIDDADSRILPPVRAAPC